MSSRRPAQELLSKPTGTKPATAELVEQWFATAVMPASRNKKFSVPDHARCADVARSLNQMPLDFRRTLHPDLAPGEAAKYAGLLLKHLPAEVARFDRIEKAVGATPARKAARMTAGRLLAFIDELREVLTILDDMNMRAEPAWHYVAHNIAGIAMGAWLDTDGAFPKSLNASDHMVAFVQLALVHIEGMWRSAETVSSALKKGGAAPGRKRGTAKGVKVSF